jgi:hypothetical protein
MVCSTSRASAFLARQAVAPKPIIWRHSAVVGLLASTMSRTSGKAACRSRSSDGLESVAKLRIATSGSCTAKVFPISSGGTSVATSRRCESPSISDCSPRVTMSSNCATVMSIGWRLAMLNCGVCGVF